MFLLGLGCDMETARIITVDNKEYQWTQKNGLELDAVFALRNYIWHHAYRYLPRMRREGYELEDIVQLGYIGAIKKAKTFNPDKTCFVTAAIYGILGEWQNACRRHNKNEVELDESIEANDTTEYRVVQKCDIKKALQGCNKYQKKLLFMFFYLGMTYDEIGKVIHRSSFTVKKRMNCAWAVAMASLLNISIDEATARVKAMSLKTITSRAQGTCDRMRGSVKKARRASKAKQASKAA